MRGLRAYRGQLIVMRGNEDMATTSVATGR